MRIDYLKINGFGKLENKEIEFGKNINLVLGENEAGKSTLLKCILAMFYGLSKNKNGKDIPDSEQYKPWGNAEFSGKMKYTLDSGEELELFRDFSKKNPKIFNENSEDISKTFNIDKTKGNEFFYEQTKIDEEMFLATGLAEQQKVVLDGKEKMALTQKIANILTSGEENISYKKAIEKLNKDLIENIGTERTVGRPINIVQEKLERIQEKKRGLSYKEERKEEIINEKENINNNLKKHQEKLNTLKEIRNIKNRENIEQEKIKVREAIVEDYEEKIKSINNKTPKRQGKLIPEIIILTILIILGIVLFIFNKGIPAGILVGIAVLWLIFIVLDRVKFNQLKLAQSKEIKILEENKKEKEEEILREKENIINKFEKEKNDAVKGLELSERYEIENILKLGENELNIKISELEENISREKIGLNTIEIEEQNIIKDLDEKIELEEEFEKVSQEKENLLQEAKKIKLAKDFLEKAYTKMKSEITPKLSNSLSKIASKISNGKYTNIKLNDEEGLLVELENGEYINANRLSAGTIDQLYLSLRLSAFKEITNESIPIILDESFAYYDNERLQNILKYLNDNFKDNQIIIFTCTGREKEMLEKLKIEYNFITL